MFTYSVRKRQQQWSTSAAGEGAKEDKHLLTRLGRMVNVSPHLYHAACYSSLLFRWDAPLWVTVVWTNGRAQRPLALLWLAPWRSSPSPASRCGRSLQVGLSAEYSRHDFKCWFHQVEDNIWKSCFWIKNKKKHNKFLYEKIYSEVICTYLLRRSKKKRTH